MTDGKTGGFLDQAENHARAAEYVPAGAEALDAFAYHGGFALALARGGARSVLALDEAAPAVERARANAARNRLERSVTVEQANAFNRLRALESEGRSFDVVVVDPPALAKRKSAFGAAERAYKELNLRALGWRVRAASSSPAAARASSGPSASARSSRTRRATPAARCSSSSGAAPGAITRRFSACPKPSISSVGS